MNKITAGALIQKLGKISNELEGIIGVVREDDKIHKDVKIGQIERQADEISILAAGLAGLLTAGRSGGSVNYKVAGEKQRKVQRALGY